MLISSHSVQGEESSGLASITRFRRIDADVIRTHRVRLGEGCGRQTWAFGNCGVLESRKEACRSETSKTTTDLKKGRTLWLPLSETDMKPEDGAISKLFAHFVGTPLKEARGFSDEEVQRRCSVDRRRRAFENAYEDFITIVLTTPIIRTGEETLRVELLKITQLLGEREWECAMYRDDERFRKELHWSPDLVTNVLTLLRQSARECSQTYHARSFMRHGRSHPTAYSESTDQAMLESIVAAMRDSLVSNGNGSRD